MTLYTERKKKKHTLTTHKSWHPPWQLWNALTPKQTGLVWTFFTDWRPDLDQYSVLKKNTSHARLGVRAFQSCQGGCQLSWVGRVYLTVLILVLLLSVLVLIVLLVVQQSLYIKVLLLVVGPLVLPFVLLKIKAIFLALASPGPHTLDWFSGPERTFSWRKNSIHLISINNKQKVKTYTKKVWSKLKIFYPKNTKAYILCILHG